ncbi:hypothetical protein GCWU000246_00541 [Jonquetella anthropi E3_33 E1]|nr:hypothetical protein GCWU000246_00541 [Jonquetella anthropi E3_33 E1]
MYHPARFRAIFHKPASCRFLLVQADFTSFFINQKYDRVLIFSERYIG